MPLGRNLLDSERDQVCVPVFVLIEWYSRYFEWYSHYFEQSAQVYLDNDHIVRADRILPKTQEKAEHK